ncbi:MAG: tRNA (N(6)-L-threonylcarbamoyladenosine(37)-C(2))-methylthiotransferase MtaB [Clostridia bacterium]|jgi:threonylcarbamoyladenosine tRNA methylthiotransferase MtaB
MKKIFSIITLGCKVNQYESSSIATTLTDMGYEYREFPCKCDICLVNTCTVTSISDKKSRQMISRVSTSNPGCIIIATGCLAQRDPDTLKKCGAHIITGNHEKASFREILEAYIKQKDPTYTDVTEIGSYREFEHMEYPDSWERIRGYVKIEDGCDNFCSYCIIPYVRGRVRSRDMDDIYREVSFMAEKGLKEVVLTGIHLDSYGKDLEGVDLGDVINRLSGINAIKRIRLGSLEPVIITDVFIAKVKSSDKLCPEFHLSLQSGSDKVLKDMNRKYTRQQYIDAVNKIRDNYADAEITTDIIVGYPTESDDDFLESVSIVKVVRFLKVHVFKFSKRKGTKAANLKELDPDILNERSGILIAEARKMSEERMSHYLNKTVEVLAEHVEKDMVIGHTCNFMKVIARAGDAETSADKINNFINVRITDVSDEQLIGDIIYD